MLPIERIKCIKHLIAILDDVKKDDKHLRRTVHKYFEKEQNDAVSGSKYNTIITLLRSVPNDRYNDIRERCFFVCHDRAYVNSINKLFNFIYE